MPVIWMLLQWITCVSWIKFNQYIEMSNIRKLFEELYKKGEAVKNGIHVIEMNEKWDDNLAILSKMEYRVYIMDGTDGYCFDSYRHYDYENEKFDYYWYSDYEGFDDLEVGEALQLVKEMLS